MNNHDVLSKGVSWFYDITILFINRLENDEDMNVSLSPKV